MKCVTTFLGNAGRKDKTISSIKQNDHNAAIEYEHHYKVYT